MIKTIKTNLNTLESMIYFWQASSENEKVPEDYLAEIASHPEMAVLYNDDFTEASVRKILSCLTNHEKLSDINETEYKFLHDNMWVMDDVGVMNMMVAPIKVLNADALVEKVNAKKDIPYEKVEIFFIPGTDKDCIIKGNQLYINFFKVQADLYDEDNVTVNGQPVLEYIEDKILELA